MTIRILRMDTKFRQNRNPKQINNIENKPKHSEGGQTRSTS